MENYYNMSLYGNTQDDITSSQYSAQDFMLTQNSYDLSRYTKENQGNSSNNLNALEIIKEEDIYSQAEQMFYENEKASLQKATFIEQNLANNFNNNASSNKAAIINNNSLINNSINNLNSNSFANIDNNAKNNYAPNKPSSYNNPNTAANNNANNANNNKGLNNNNNNFKVNNGSSAAANSNNNLSLIEEKFFLISQEIDKIEEQQKEDSLKKLNLTANNPNTNAIGKNQNNLAANKNQSTNNNNINNNTSLPANNNQNKFTHNAANNTNNNNQKANKLKNDLLNADPPANLNLKTKADFQTEKKQSAQKKNSSHFNDESLNLNTASSNSNNFVEELNQELFLKIKSATDVFLTEFDAYSNKINSLLANFKRVFLSDVNAVYRVLKEETAFIVSEEEKNRMIDEKIKFIFNEMMGVFNQISPKGI